MQNKSDYKTNKEQQSEILNIISSNICGCVNNHMELKCVEKKLNPHLVLLNETHLIDEVYDKEINIKGYQMIRTDSNSMHTGGTCV